MSPSATRSKRRSRASRGLPARLERVVRLLNGGPILELCRAAAVLAVACHGWLAPLAALGGRVLLSRGTCCPEGGVHACFVDRFVERVSGARWVDTLWRAANEAGATGAALRLEALARITLLGALRHWLLAVSRRLTGAPATTIMEALVAAYPACDLACTGCYTQDERGSKRMPRLPLAELVDEAAACGAWGIHLVGKGEPFLDDQQAQEICDVAAGRPHLMFLVATSAQRVSASLARRLGRLGNVVLLVSIDGPREVHDARRGRGTHDRVMASLATLRRHGVIFGFSATVFRGNHQAVTAPAFVERLAGTGCVLGLYSRYFPLAADGWRELTLGPRERAEHEAAFARARSAAPIPLLDLDEFEGDSGCRSRAGLLVHLDGLTGQVSPCIRTPFSPPDCRLDLERGRGLSEVLGHEFFARYRSTAASRRTGCCGDLGGELASLGDELATFGCAPPALAAYRDRAREGARPLPIVREGSHDRREVAAARS